MKVLITDYAWESLQPEREILASAGATLVVAERGDEDELASLAKDVDGILTCWKPVTARVIRRAERCRAIGRYGIGVDNIDVECATELGIVVTNVSAYCVEEVAEHAMALLLSLARKVTAYDHAMKAGPAWYSDRPQLKSCAPGSARRDATSGFHPPTSGRYLSGSPFTTDGTHHSSPLRARDAQRLDYLSPASS